MAQHIIRDGGKGPGYRTQEGRVSWGRLDGRIIWPNDSIEVTIDDVLVAACIVLRTEGFDEAADLTGLARRQLRERARKAP